VVFLFVFCEYIADIRAMWWMLPRSSFIVYFSFSISLFCFIWSTLFYLIHIDLPLFWQYQCVYTFFFPSSSEKMSSCDVLFISRFRFYFYINDLRLRIIWQTLLQIIGLECKWHDNIYLNKNDRMIEGERQYHTWIISLLLLFEI